MSKKSTDTSKFLSYVLRHKPEAIELTLDKEGWAVIDELILRAGNKGYALDKDLIFDVVESSEKKRFMISEDGLRIRAAQGHSTQQVNITYAEKTPPDVLYHGTATRFIAQIREQGLLPLSRQYVHISSDEATAIQVGQRYGKPVLLKIKAVDMYKKGFKFYQADNGVWLTEHVPYEYIQE
ncbi:RNA 2'-phosphotransferase [Kosakonia cowanii]|uniref:RNA 2'-phosphotransferase n=1 Tax=Kosakonia cowanii TaxID=208223 RepID=UPI0023F7BFB4|nr:RNA 2'-phosphotransferase [Kosakonia cowanii]MDF7758537.1 RNA 2'-phosphotransferase [Kosakonia cowanii]